MVVRMLASVANPRFVAAAGDVLEVPKSIGQELLKLRMEGTRGPVCEVVTAPALVAKAKPLHLCAEADAWEDNDE